MKTYQEIIVDVFFGLLFWLLTYFIVSWLVDGSFWLHFFLATALNSYQISSQISNLKNELKKIDNRINVMDYEIVRISPIIDENYEKIDDLDRRFNDLEYRIDEISKYK
jgi:peptidoglycan hydrolase CwlO-like protein